MKILYWNIRGVANSPSRLALKRLVVNNNPDFVFIAEPWMNFSDLPRGWLARMGLKMFGSNDRGQRQSNLWCFCKDSVNPIIISSNDQQVSFSFSDNNKSFCMAAIYASNDYIKRRDLWKCLSDLQQQFRQPWCFIGDFNTILGAHEHRGNAIPARAPIEDFQNWTDSNYLLHLSTSGATFTWSNGRGGSRHTERRLDRTICNQDWVDACTSMNCSTLVRTTSDHYPLLLDCNTHDLSFKASFKFMKMWSLHEGCHAVIADSWKENVIGCPMFILSTKLKRLKEKLRRWNKDIFGNVHSYVNEAEQDLSNIQAQLQTSGHTDSLRSLERIAQSNLAKALIRQEEFWKEKARLNWQLEGDRNTSFFHRITKIKNSKKLISSLKNNNEVITDQNQLADHVVDYFKNVFCTNTVLQDQLLVEEVIPSLIDDNVNTLLTLIPSRDEIKNAVFSLNKDSAPGPDGYGAFFYQKYWEIIHDDVVKAVLQFFTTGWIMPNFNSNTLILIPKTNNADSIDQFRPIAMANFKFKIISKVLADRGVRQGDPLSPLLFCLAEEVLSRGIAKLVSDGSMDLIKGSRNSLVPSHCLYADDIMVFCRGKLSCIQALKSLFIRYANCSGQIINAAKSTIYSGGITPSRLNIIVNNIGFNVGSFPFNYLGVPIFKGKPKATFFYPIADKIKNKLSAWKASLLSIAGRVQLVKSVIQSMTIYSISIYSWPSSILKSIEAWIRNFIWSGNIDQRKLVTVAWKKICAPFDEGGLGLRSLKVLNAAANLKLCWDLMHSDEDWAKILRNRVMRKGKAINHHVNSSIWSSVKQEVQVILDNSCWRVGNGSDNGLLTLKIAYDFKRPHAPFLPWAKSIWSKDIPPTRSLLVWRVMLDKVPTDDKLIERGCNLPSMCSLYVNLHFSSMTDIWQVAENWSPQCKVVINAALVHILYAIWIARNKVRFKMRSLAGDLQCHGFLLIFPWLPPLSNWVKCNTDGASTNASSACGGLFRNSNADFLYGFAENPCISSAFVAELCGAMNAIEIAASKNWNNLWLETDSTLVVLAFKSSLLVPWDLSNRWRSCLLLTQSMNFIVSHIFREGNF
ncbi:hypothetical protein TSUD_409650 [Trifolium subterraneum]|uniref:Reverse transcriptase domain-containing protein n=1 Tax=Trifolium subterraneum TaxID=3900 RepID=A0A2Z6PH94_TRISU|nr:hypothetical protein TSUD_409650 [Trifolium subterraneum]